MTKKNNKVTVKRSKTGLGLFALKPIPAEKRIIEYVGTILTDEQANKKGGKFLYDLGNNLAIDGSSRENLARYINHSCCPNTEAYTGRNRVWIWSMRDIEEGEELTIDYGKEYFDQHIKPVGCKCESCTSKKRRSKNSHAK